MTDAITWQVSKQVKRAMEAANSSRPLPDVDYIPTHGGEPSHRLERIPSPRYTEREREVSWSDRSGRPYTEQLGRCAAARPSAAPRRGQRPNQQLLPHPMEPISGRLPGSRSKSRIPSLGDRYQSGHATTECPELKKALYELPDKGQIDRFLKRGPRWGPYGRDNLVSLESSAQKCTAGAYHGARTSVTVPTMVFGGKEAPRFASPLNNPLVIEMKIASTIMWRFLIDTGSSVDIITWDCVNKLTHPGRDIVPLVYPILGFVVQEVNPTGMIRLLAHFGDKLKSKSLEVDFLVVDVPTAYNVILGHPTLHKRGPAGSLAPWPMPPFPPPWPHQPRPSQAPPLAGAVSPCFRLPGRPDQPSAFPNYRATGPSNLRHFAAALTPRANTSATSSVTLGGFEVPGVAKSQDLTKSWTKLGCEVRLDEVGGWPLGAQGKTASSLRSSPYGLKRGGLFLEIGSTVPGRLTSRVPRGRPFGSGFSSTSRGGRRGLIGTTLNSLTLSNR
ncbi:LOW QUALITY PROTEIN: hypothetical protein Cgig2_012684 [Carnegiea gigantea]|uniref:Uncharacterized protein n=1 Tax=Carnegiea gigantea TaxID=171969 RepID=A0A9Q1JYX7_9CARY|nr:LOW QUALITY PROTEIN: hypothetical protein Cgig2_012684 [Carnegiea gigantea]